MNRNRHTAIRLVLALAGAVPSLALATQSTVTAIPSLVPGSAVYSIGGPATPLQMTYQTSADAAELIVSAEGFVTAIECPAGLTTAVDAGVGAVTADGGGVIPASTLVECTVSLGLGDGAPDTVTVIVSERDAFNVELAAASQIVALEEIDVTATLDGVVLTGGTYHAAEPRSVGDELTATYTFGLPSARSVSFRIPSGASSLGCDAQAADSVTCVTTRTLSLADLTAGTASLAPTLLVDGFPVALPADVAVPSERRISVEATATPDLVRVGETVAIEAIVTNLGTVDLSELVLGGAGIASATCDGQDPATITLVPGASVVCSATLLASSADVGDATPVVVRATPSFGTDSDLVDDDATSATDVDAVSLGVPYTVVDADVSAALTLGAAVAFVDDGGTDTLPLTLTVSTTGSLAGVHVTLPAAPAPGLAVHGCQAAGADCVVAIGPMDAGAVVDVPLELVVDASSLPVGGVDLLEVAGSLTADGDIVVDVSPAVVRTAGVSAAVIPSTVEATGTHATFDVEFAVAAGHPVAVTLAPTAQRPAAVIACSDAAGQQVSFASSGGSAQFGSLDGGTIVTCALSQAVLGSDRTSASMPVDVVLTASAGSALVGRSVHADLDTMSLVVVPGVAPAPPAHGYSIDGSPGRPTTISYPFRLATYGDVTVGGTVPFAADVVGVDSYACSPVAADPRQLACLGTHTVTAADLARGSYTAVIEASVGASAVARASVRMVVPHESLDVLVTELSTPNGPNGYRPGESIRLLVQLRNRGNVALRLDAVSASLATVTPGLPESIGDCGGGAVLAPGDVLGCDLVVTAPAGFEGPTVTVTVTVAQLGPVATDIDLAFDPVVAPSTPTTVPAATPGTLPVTGASPNHLMTLALGLMLGGGLLTRASRRRVGC